MRMRKSAEGLGKDLKREREQREKEQKERKEEERRKEKNLRKEVEDMKREVEKMERGKKQAGAELRVLRERIGMLEGQKSSWEDHVCEA